MRRLGVSMVELLIATAILGGAVMVAYGWLQQDFRFGVDLGARETADTLARNMLERFRRMPPEQMLALVGEDGEVNVGDLKDPTLDRVDQRSAAELQRLGFERTVQAWRGGPLGRVSFAVRSSYLSTNGRRQEFVYGVAQVGTSNLGQGKNSPRQPDTASGFRRRKQASSWGRADGWSVKAPPPSAATDADPGAAGGPRQGAGQEPAVPPASSASQGAGSSGQGGSGGPGASPSSGSGSRRFGGPDLAELVRRAGQGATAVARDYRPPSAPPAVTGDAALIAATTGPEGVMARSYREAVDRLRQAGQAREARFLARTLASTTTAGLKTIHIPAGEYTYLLEVLDLRRQTPPRLVGVFSLRREAERFHLVDRRSPGRHALGGDQVLATRYLSDDQDRGWDLMRTEEQLFLVERPAGFFPARLIVVDLPGPDGGLEGTALTRRALASLVAKWGLATTGGEPDDLLEVAAQRGAS